MQYRDFVDCGALSFSDQRPGDQQHDPLCEQDQVQDSADTVKLPEPFPRRRIGRFSLERGYLLFYSDRVGMELEHDEQVDKQCSHHAHKREPVREF